MNDKLEFHTLLVPTDFSEASRAAFDHALSIAQGENAVVIVQHVIDPTLVEFATGHGLATKEEALARMRSRAEKAMDEYTPPSTSSIKLKKIIGVGQPFLEIIDKARDLSVDAVVIGKVGARGSIEKMLFGSTVEKVIRGCCRPVLVLPVED
jgi:nucleotide-binding universal stress UspA family protein